MFPQQNTTVYLQKGRFDDQLIDQQNDLIYRDSILSTLFYCEQIVYAALSTTRQQSACFLNAK